MHVYVRVTCVPTREYAYAAAAAHEDVLLLCGRFLSCRADGGKKWTRSGMQPAIPTCSLSSAQCYTSARLVACRFMRVGKCRHLF